MELNDTGGSAESYDKKSAYWLSPIQLLGEKVAALNGSELKRLKEKEALTNVIIKCKLSGFSLMVRINGF